MCQSRSHLGSLSVGRARCFLATSPSHAVPSATQHNSQHATQLTLQSTVLRICLSDSLLRASVGFGWATMCWRLDLAIAFLEDMGGPPISSGEKECTPKPSGMLSPLQHTPDCSTKTRRSLKQPSPGRRAPSCPSHPSQPPFPLHRLLHPAIHTAAGGSSRRGSRRAPVPSTRGRRPRLPPRTAGPAATRGLGTAARAAGRHWSGGAGSGGGSGPAGRGAPGRSCCRWAGGGRRCGAGSGDPLTAARPAAAAAGAAWSASSPQPTARPVPPRRSPCGHRHPPEARRWRCWRTAPLRPPLRRGGGRPAAWGGPEVGHRWRAAGPRGAAARRSGG